jgi:hypothetical protein
VRRLVGYQRLEAPGLAALERVHDLARDYMNFLHPVRKLTEKIRLGARVTRRYDTAQTPYRRLLASGCLSEKAVRQLAVRSKALAPLRLKTRARIRPAHPRRARRAARARCISPFGRNNYEAAVEPLVGSSIEARRGYASFRCGRGAPARESIAVNRDHE